MVALFLPRAVKFDMRWKAPLRSGGREGGACLSNSPMESCLKALATIKKQGLARRVSQSGSRMRRHRGAMDMSVLFSMGVLDLRCRQLAASLEDSSTLK